MICGLIQTVDVDVVREPLLRFEDLDPNFLGLLEILGRTNFLNRNVAHGLHFSGTRESVNVLANG